MHQVKVSKPVKSKQRLLSYLLGCTTLFMGLVINISKNAIAQITPDNTLGAESSTINHGALKDIINGGATRGTNLFHSFQEFNVDAGKSVYFANPTGIENILTRVTGGNVSNILGTLGVEGTANLFLINPNGIFFGNGASLDIRGSFTATTADSIKLGENGLFSATAPATSHLLNIQPEALFRNALRNQQAEIKSEGNLTVGQNLTFNADNLNLSGQIQAGGNLNLKANHTISIDGGNINTDNYGTGQGGDINITTGSLYLTNASILSASTYGQGDAGTMKITATDSVKFDGRSYAASQVGTGAVGKAGGVDISTKSLELLGGSFLDASTLGQGDAGTVKITATDSVKFDGGSYAESRVGAGAVGNAGGVDISTKTLELLGGSFLSASTFGQGDAGTVKITATDAVKFDGNSSAGSQVQTGAVGKAGGVDISTKSLELLGGSELRANTFGQGDAGTVKITANTLNITNNSTIKTNTSSSGNAGDILVNTSTLNLTNGGNIFAFTNGSGNGGTVTINALNSVNIGEGVQNFAPIISVETNNTGKAGDIIINSPNFTLSETARITATTTETATNQDYGGSITLNASKINLAGVVGVFAETQGQAPAGTLKLNPYQNQPDLDITMFPNSILSASTSASGKGGDLQITAPENINISGQGKLAVESKGSGDAGNILITSQNLNLSDGVKISASTSGSGKGGNIIVKVKDKITLDGTNTGLFASTEKGSTGDSGSIDIDPQIFIIKNGAGIGVNSQGSGKGGDISVQAGTLTLDNKAFINAATASSQGGGITLQIKDLLFMRHHSNITATAGTDQSGGNGGNININSPFIVAVPYENNDITANAYLGKGGNINITTNQLFGLQYRPQETALSDITASSEFGVSGNVEITTPGVDPTSGLTNLPTSLVDAESLNKDVCAIKDDKIAGGSSFIITGKGGLPADTHELISNSPAFVEWENISPNLTQVSTSPVKVTQKNTNHHPQIQQAQGWMVTPDGKVVLTADPEKVTLQADKNNLPDCK